jgi:hypothetical protein
VKYVVVYVCEPDVDVEIELVEALCVLDAVVPVLEKAGWSRKDIYSLPSDLAGIKDRIFSGEGLKFGSGGLIDVKELRGVRDGVKIQTPRV